MLQTDLAGIGIGPFNLGLAALLSCHDNLSAVFLERKSSFRWHEGLMLPGTTLQVPFLADLVTMADPTHRLSFLNYLHEHDRLYKFYFHDRVQILREEYDHYCRWAAQQLPSCRFGESVTDVGIDPASGGFLIDSQSDNGMQHRYRGRDIALGIGTAPHLPDWAQVRTSSLIIHSAEFAFHREQLARCRRVTVIGSGQSAAECVLALCDTLSPHRVAAGASILWITRSAGFFPMEYSKLGQECYTPEYMRHFHAIERDRRRAIVAGQDLLYKGISFSTIGALFDLLYERSIGGRDPGLSLHSNCAVDAVTSDAAGELSIDFRHRELDQAGQIRTDAIVAATGYRHIWPDWLQALKIDVLETDAHGDLLVGDDFIARRRDGGKGRVFVQNAEVFQHGVGAPDLGIGAYRNSVIANALLGRPHYRASTASSFQCFGMPETSAEPQRRAG